MEAAGRPGGETGSPGFQSIAACLSINSSDAFRNGFIPTIVSQGASEVGKKSSEVYWDIKGVRLLQELAGEYLEHSGCSAHVTPHPPQLWVVLPPCGSCHEGHIHGAPSVCLWVACPPAHPGHCPLEMAAAWECGWGPLGRRQLDRGLSVELPGSFPGPRPMTGRLRMPPIIQLTEHKGATRGLSRPGARDGCTGAPVPHHRGQGCAQSPEGSSHAQE